MLIALVDSELSPDASRFSEGDLFSSMRRNIAGGPVRDKLARGRGRGYRAVLTAA